VGKSFPADNAGENGDTSEGVDVGVIAGGVAAAALLVAVMLALLLIKRRKWNLAGRTPPPEIITVRFCSACGLGEFRKFLFFNCEV
jgi:hypothetical protein